MLSTDDRFLVIILDRAMWSIFIARRYAKRDTCRRRVSVRSVTDTQTDRQTHDDNIAYTALAQRCAVKPASMAYI